MNKIEKLTAAQVARFPEFIEKWTKIGLSTEPADRPRAEAGINLAYKIAGQSGPKKIVWCDSPLSAGLTRAIVIGLGSVEIGNSKKASVRDSVGASVSASVWDSVWDSVGASVYGQHESSWMSFYDYFATACNLSEQTQKLAGVFEVAQSANWWLPHENICWVSERHNLLNRNSEGRLHCDDGPALSYPDKWSVWSINDVRVDEQIVMRPETQTIDQISKESNEEIRRVRIDRFGWPRYLKDSGSKSINSRRNDVDGTEERLMQLNDGSLRLLCACRSTARVYAIRVPREIETCEQAQKWMAGGSSPVVKRGNCVGAS